MGLNVIQQNIEDLVKIHLAPFFKKLGYRKSGRTFSFQWDNNYKIVNVQSWKYNYASSGKFTVNLSVYLSKAQESTNFIAKTFPPKEYECQIRERIGILIDRSQGDFWWEVFPSTDVSELAKTIISHFENSAIPWLDEMSAPERAAEYYLATNQKGMAALFYFVAGNIVDSSKLVHEILRSNHNDRFKNYWREWAERNEVIEKESQ